MDNLLYNDIVFPLLLCGEKRIVDRHVYRSLLGRYVPGWESFCPSSGNVIPEAVHDHSTKVQEREEAPHQS